jgi:hypothetical protein
MKKALPGRDKIADSSPFTETDAKGATELFIASTAPMKGSSVAVLSGLCPLPAGHGGIVNNAGNINWVVFIWIYPVIGQIPRKTRMWR